MDNSQLLCLGLAIIVVICAIALLVCSPGSSAPPEHFSQIRTTNLTNANKLINRVQGNSGLAEHMKLPLNRRNPVAGPEPKQYFAHDIPATITPEEGPLPIQGNVGIMLGNQLNNFKDCSFNPEDSIGGGPNCSWARGPKFAAELRGASNFGLSGDRENQTKSSWDPSNQKVQGSQCSALNLDIKNNTNVRACMGGQQTKDGSQCYNQFWPALTKNNNNVCELEPSTQIGDFYPYSPMVTGRTKLSPNEGGGAPAFPPTNTLWSASEPNQSLPGW